MDSCVLILVERVVITSVWSEYLSFLLLSLNTVYIECCVENECIAAEI